MLSSTQKSPQYFRCKISDERKFKHLNLNRYYAYYSRIISATYSHVCVLLVLLMTWVHAFMRFWTFRLQCDELGDYSWLLAFAISALVVLERCFHGGFGLNQVEIPIAVGNWTGVALQRVSGGLMSVGERDRI